MPRVVDKDECRIVSLQTDETFERQIAFACNTKKKTSAALVVSR